MEQRSIQTKTRTVRLMCCGDSITDGFCIPGGYRRTLCRLLAAHRQETQIEFVGQNRDCTPHAGFTGFSVADIAQEDSVSGPRTGLTGIAAELLQACAPDAVFLQIGTNDILSLYDLPHFGERLQTLADIFLQALPPHGRLFLATLPDLDARNPTYLSPQFFTPDSADAAAALCNAQIQDLAKREAEAGKPVTLADIHGVLTKADLYDGVHPNEAGCEKMGRFWYEQLCGYLRTVT